MTRRISAVSSRLWRLPAAALRRGALARRGLDASLRRGLVVLGLGLALAAAACSPIYRNHGYVPADDQLAQIEVGRDSREDVAQKIGRPSAQGLLNDVGWFYVQSRFEHFGPRVPKEIDRQVVAVTFNGNGVVDGVGRYGLEDGQVVAISRRVTETHIKGVSFIGQLLGSFGRVTADQLINN
ncbi:outer membrane protein assembly factor BamE [Pseudogemmobacter sonorensis]|uniref:outer membrane protein assembly factor BamE n=1 Tax=Pseudogemmobacter sonorensis TaxID=2989681 RepID=UPI0036C78887